MLEYLFINKTIKQNPKNFKEIQRVIIYYILQRKMKRKQYLKFEDRFDAAKVKKSLEVFQKFKSSKRFEENFKFLYKFSCRIFKNRLKLENRNIDEKQLNYKFLEFYFSQASKKSGIKLIEFSDPAQRPPEVYQFKTFGKKFLNLILQSDKFKTDFLGYIHDELLIDYQKCLEKKIKKIFRFLKRKVKKIHWEKFTQKEELQ